MADKKPNYTQRLRSEITDSIVKNLKDGNAPWRQPWGNNGVKGSPQGMIGMPCNFSTGKSYKGINPLILMMTAEMHGFKSRFWGTHKQWGELGAYVKPHPATVAPKDWGARIVFHTMIEKELSEDEKKKRKKKPTTKTITAPKTKKPKDNEEETEKIFFLRGFTVFNAEQVAAPDVEFLLSRPKALDAFIKKVGQKGKTKEEWAQYIHDTVEERLKKYLFVPEAPKPKTKKKKDDTFKPAEELMAATGADIRYGGSRAFYRRRPGDFIQLPEKEQFDTLSAFYETAFHELVHWSEDESRLGRHKAEGDQYAYGELVAEIGASFIAQQIGVPFAKDLLPNTQRYLKYWLSKMGDDPKFIFKASGEASKRADYLLAFVGQDEKEETPAEGEVVATGTYN